MAPQKLLLENKLETLVREMYERLSLQLVETTGICIAKTSRLVNFGRHL